MPRAKCGPRVARCASVWVAWRPSSLIPMQRRHRQLCRVWESNWNHVQQTLCYARYCYDGPTGWLAAARTATPIMQARPLQQRCAGLAVAASMASGARTRCCWAGAAAAGVLLVLVAGPCARRCFRLGRWLSVRAEATEARMGAGPFAWRLALTCAIN